MKRLILLSLVVIKLCYAPPVQQTKKEDGEESGINGLEDYMEYHRYLKEVVNALESDPDFRQKLEKADESDIKSGKIAEELEFVSHHVRTRLDEIKRVELERLKDLTEKKRRLEDPNSIVDDPTHHHIDHSNQHTFEIEDLKKLIAKTTADLAEADKKRKEQFKEYELEKEYKKQEKLNHTNGEEKKKLEKEFQEMEQKHKKHEKLHEPGHQAQLEEVWEEQDQMQQDFNPKTFFMLHDVDGNGLWDQDEVKALFVKELDKMYQEGAPEDDMRERYEEMERMRESVFNEMDQNRDGFIDYNEFFHQTNTNDFKQDHGWQGLDEQRPYTDEELAEYIRQQEMANQIPQGHHPGAYQGPPHGYIEVPRQGQVPPGAHQQVPPGAYQQVPQGSHQIPQGGYQQVPQGGYQQVPPGAYQQMPQGGYQQAPNNGHQQQIPQGGHQQQLSPGGYQQQVPQGGYQQQVPQGGYQQHIPQGGHQQQVPQGGHQQQVPQGGHQQQVPQSGHQQQVPQGGYQQQVPQGGHQQQVPQGGHQQQVPQGGHQQQVPQGGYQQQVPQGSSQQAAGGVLPQVQVEHQANEGVSVDHLNTNEVNPGQQMTNHQQPNVQAVPQQINQQQNSPK